MTALNHQTDETLDRMLAELDGWIKPTDFEVPTSRFFQKMAKKRDACGMPIWQSPPRYTQSLDECARVEAGLRPCDIDTYVERVGEIVRDYWLRQGKDVPGFSDQSVIFAHMTATARQRTIALIQTLQSTP